MGNANGDKPGALVQSVDRAVSVLEMLARDGESGITEIAAELAGEVRASAADDAQTRAQRASVWITAPLATCFLPAFLCLGVLPVLVGMLHRLTIQL